MAAELGPLARPSHSARPRNELNYTYPIKYTLILLKIVKRLHNSYSYKLFISMRGGGMGILDKKRNTMVKFENKWRKAPRKLYFLRGKTPL